MASSPETIAASIQAAVAPGFRERLLARGQARSIIWQDGQLPPDAPPFSAMLSHDLTSYGYALLVHGLRLLDLNGDRDLARVAFEHSAEAIEAVFSKGENDPSRDFHRLVAATAYHLGRFSARAYSLLSGVLAEANLSVSERSLALLMVRDLNELNRLVSEFCLGNSASDENLIELLSTYSQQGEGDDAEPGALDDVVELSLTDGFLRALATALLAFERGDRQLVDRAIASLRLGLESSSEFGLVQQWWCHRLAIHLLGELWDVSFHERLPQSFPGPGAIAWPELRELFIASLFCRARAEIDLWPSQIDAAARAIDLADNMVLSLPTSAGKTRIAELCILACLASGRRVVFVTPLRALSAQTEVNLLRTFRPLGKSVSSLYGSIGVSEVDEDLLRDRDIIVTTPEKLDFALRNDNSLLDDVGLVVLDEGHMIGLGEREIRYENQIQRLLKRSDAASRRIICLSAILPTGEKLEDFASWLTCDHLEGLIQKDWRPTRLRFGEVEWLSDHAKLNISVGDEQPFVPKFITARVPPGRRKQFPDDQRELCLATAWRLVEDGQTVLIFCPQRRSVEPFAEAIVKLHRQGALPSVLDGNAAVLASALAIGAEWFGVDHALLKCLRLGVAVHHGALPTPYRKEVERLLRDGVLKITISSPTLAQGLNLSATALVFHGLKRTKDLIEVSEFRNVIGRAGRAYIDVEGLVLYPMFDGKYKRRKDWRELVEADGGKEMESGLVRLLITLLGRMQKKIGTKDVNKLLEYVANNAAWNFYKLPGETIAQTSIEETRWSTFLTTLDTAILTLLGEHDVPEAKIESTLEKVLESSLWSRRLKRRNEATQKALIGGLVARAKYVWSHSTPKTRRGYFLAGVGLDTGRKLDASADRLAELLVEANAAILSNEQGDAVKAISSFASLIFSIRPFAPDDLPANWKAVLSAWLRGKPIMSLAAGNEAQVLRFIEEALVYKLPWGMEAVRVRGLALEDKIGQFSLSDFELSVAVAAVETGSLNRSAALLMRSGFTSRTGAIKAVEDTAATFTTLGELRQWLKSKETSDRYGNNDWPTPETNSLWRSFVDGMRPDAQKKWKKSSGVLASKWYGQPNLDVDSALRIVGSSDGSKGQILGPDYELLGEVSAALAPDRLGLLLATVKEKGKSVAWTYLGPDDPFSGEAGMTP
jgi:superfamily II DNA/RNA helicase